MKYIIYSEFSEAYSDETFDGVFIVEAPENTDVKKDISNICKCLEEFEDMYENDSYEEILETPDEDLDTRSVEVKKFIDKCLANGFKIEELADWTSYSSYGSSIESYLGIAEKIFGWKYDYLHIDGYFDADNKNWF